MLFKELQQLRDGRPATQQVGFILFQRDYIPHAPVKLQVQGYDQGSRHNATSFLQNASVNFFHARMDAGLVKHVDLLRRSRT